ncbi:hypothetical protein GCM10010274_57830 [Streptomyces lavendofoliae]|uniref:Uncharacterized protein n=1 Tax=Streptomyces lavendofoliae TaxID=67314 RepID=A0A918M7P9_9ACTN|nr:hypothetical protein GCM10010274_57830 [Streptomyces lavendofoliae]
MGSGSASSARAGGTTQAITARAITGTAATPVSFFLIIPPQKFMHEAARMVCAAAVSEPTAASSVLDTQDSYSEEELRKMI